MGQFINFEMGQLGQSVFKFQSQSRAEDVSDDIALVVEKVQQFPIIPASARREESNAGLLLSWVPVMTLQKRCKATMS